MKAVLRVISSLALVLAALAIASPPADASLQVESFTTESSDTRAGGHPDLSTSFSLEEAGVTESAKNIVFDAPQGVFGNPNATNRCTADDFGLDQCPSDSQVGVITVYANYEGNPHDLLGTAPIYDLEPGPNTALFAFIVPTLDISIRIPVAVRTGSDYGLRFTVTEISQATPLAGAALIFWGVPSDTTNTNERFPKGSPGKPAGCPGLADTSCITSGGEQPATQPYPLTDNPTICTGSPLVTSLEVQTYQSPDTPTVVHGSYPPTTECEREVFRPVMYTTLTNEQADSPSGLNIELVSQQFLSKAAAPSEIRSATVTLPPGLTINPDAADGQRACSDAQANFGTEGPAECPDNAKIGTFELHTVALNDALEGAVYIGEPKPNEQYRLFLVAQGSGINAKLEASVRPDPATGQVTVGFQELPQVPFDSIAVHLFASDRGLMATPTGCTLHEVTGRFFPWNAVLADQAVSRFLSISAGPGGAACPGPVRPFNPRLVAGTSNSAAGAFSSFHLRLERDDGDQFLKDVNFRMPAGFTGSLRGISYCSEAGIAAAATRSGRAEEAAPSCPASSQVGTTNVAAGPGRHPFHAVGSMYLAGPFQGAPLSLVAITPALAGPYDYGVVVVRVALHVDPLTAQVSAVSGEIPLIIGGVPIRMRSIQVNIDRPNFTINPTNCTPTSVQSQGIGDQGTVTDFSSYFNAVNCTTLPFGPHMKMSRIGGLAGTKRAGDPSIRFDLFTRQGDANLRSLSLTLPNTLEIDQRHLGNLCQRSELETTHCAGRQPIGRVKDETPLLDKPLEGLAYAVSGYTGLPHVAFILGGQVTVIPQGESKTLHQGRLRTTVPVIPDVPIGHFQLTLYGGKVGYLANTRNLCAHPVVSDVNYVAQSGRKSTQKVRLSTRCGA